MRVDQRKGAWNVMQGGQDLGFFDPGAPPRAWVVRRAPLATGPGTRLHGPSLGPLAPPLDACECAPQADAPPSRPQVVNFASRDARNLEPFVQQFMRMASDRGLKLDPRGHGARDGPPPQPRWLAACHRTPRCLSRRRIACGTARARRPPSLRLPPPPHGRR